MNNVIYKYDFLKKTGETIETPIDNTPVIGHIKGGIHMAVGDTERGEDIMKSASSSTAAVVGGLAGGPAGAVSGKIWGDQIITTIDSAVHKKFKPYGAVKLGQSSDAGENFDEAMDLISQLKSKVSNSGFMCFSINNLFFSITTKYGLLIVFFRKVLESDCTARHAHDYEKLRKNISQLNKNQTPISIHSFEFCVFHWNFTQ